MGADGVVDDVVRECCVDCAGVVVAEAGQSGVDGVLGV